MSGHTPEPWLADFSFVCKDTEDFLLTIVDGQHSSYDAATKTANAYRIAACVNACAGIPTDELENVRLNAFPDLLAACEALYAWQMSDDDSLVTDAAMFKTAWGLVNAAIAKAKEATL